MSDWHSRPLEQVMKELDSRPSGLTERESAQRLERLGPNQLEPPRKPSVMARVLGQLKDPMILVLLGAAALSLAASGGEDWLDGAIILIIVLVNGVISITQEDHAQQALEELRRMSSPQAHVLREGRAKKISAAALVPGDVILLEAGDMVPADARVMECSRLQADESAMTGESVPVEKGAHDRLGWTPRWGGSPTCFWRTRRATRRSSEKWGRSPNPCPSCACRCALSCSEWD